MFYRKNAVLPHGRYTYGAHFIQAWICQFLVKIFEIYLVDPVSVKVALLKKETVEYGRHRNQQKFKCKKNNFMYSPLRCSFHFFVFTKSFLFGLICC